MQELAIGTTGRKETMGKAGERWCKAGRYYLAEEKAMPRTRMPFPWFSSIKSSSSSTC